MSQGSTTNKFFETNLKSKILKMILTDLFFYLLYDYTKEEKVE